MLNPEEDLVYVSKNQRRNTVRLTVIKSALMDLPSDNNENSGVEDHKTNYQASNNNYINPSFNKESKENVASGRDDLSSKSSKSSNSSSDDGNDTDSNDKLPVFPS